MLAEAEGSSVELRAWIDVGREGAGVDAVEIAWTASTDGWYPLVIEACDPDSAEWLVLIEAARLDWCISSTSSGVSSASDSTTAAGTEGGGVSSNRTFEVLVLLLPDSSKIGRGEGLEGPGSDSDPSNTPGRCRISSDGVV